MLAMVGIVVQSFCRFPGFPPCPVSSPARPLAVLEALWAAQRDAVVLVTLLIGLVDVTVGRQARARHW